jgi:GxxExxY protein
MNADIRDPETYAIIGAAMEVHRTLGCGFLEFVYHEALAIELAARGIPFRREAALPIVYKDNVLPCSFRVDFICFDKILLELKALATLSPIEDAQVINYLKASKLPRALLLNFGTTSLQHKRLAL